MTDYELWKNRSDRRDFSPHFYTQVIVELEARIAELEAEWQMIREKIQGWRDELRSGDEHTLGAIASGIEDEIVDVVSAIDAALSHSQQTTKETPE